MFIRSRIRSITNKKIFSNFILSILFILTFLLILFNKTDHYLVNKIKHISIDVVTPITKFVSAPITVTANIGAQLNNLRFLRAENNKLKEEIIRLKKWQTLAIKNTRENKVFKKLLNSTSNNIEIVKTASVLTHSSNIYARSITINAGTNFGVTSDMAVINNKGLVGKTVISSSKNSKIILINDQNSSVPVKSLSDRSYAIVKGSLDGKYLISAFIKNDAMPKIGDLLVTSGSAKIFPRDILVAKVIMVNQDHFIALPYVDFDNLDYVQIINSH